MTNRWLVQQKKPASRWLFISTLLGIFSGLLIIFQSGIIATIIDRVAIHHASIHAVLFFLLWLIMIIFFRATITFLRETSSFYAATAIKTTIRKNCFQYLTTLSINKIGQLKTGELTSILIEQIEALHGFYADYLPQMMIAVILPCIILIIVFIQSWMVGLILLITAPLIPLFMALIGMGATKLNQENFTVLSRMSAYFLNLLQGITTLTLFNQARAQQNSIEKISGDFRQTTMRILRVAFLSTAILELFTTISIALIAVYLGLGLLGYFHIGLGSMHISLQHALFILLLAPEFFMPLRQLGTFYHARAEAIAAAEAIQKLGSRSGSVRNNVSLPLTVENLCFSYSNNIPIFNNFALTIHHGDCIAITGQSGSGKSTLLQLLAKIISPQSGVILADKINLAEIEDDHWRKHIGFLHQNTRLFYGTILSNILLAKPTATQNEIEAAAHATGVLDFTNTLPNKLNTAITEHNGSLSGGQAQRVALARIILKNAPIILLDEPTSYLDKTNVNIILNLLKTWRGKKTVVIATHDQRIIDLCDTRVNLSA